VKRILLFLCLAISARAQTSNVVATITDPDGQTWNNGTYTITFIPTPGIPGPYTWQGGAGFPQNYTGSFSGGGNLTVSIPDNSFIAPLGSKWQFTLCGNSSAACQNVPLSVTGASPNLSTALSSHLVAPRFGPGQFAFGYRDGEVTGVLLPGMVYYNVTSLIQRIWNGTAWVNNAGGGSSYTFFGNTANPLTALTDPTTIIDAAGNELAFATTSVSLGDPINNDEFVIFPTIHEAEMVDNAGDLVSVIGGAVTLRDGASQSCILTSGTFTCSVPIVVPSCTGCGGGGGGNPQLENCTPDASGNGFYSPTTPAFTNYFYAPWQFVFNTTTYFNCTVFIPVAQEGATIVLDVATSDATAGHTASFQTCDQVINAGSTLNVGPLPCAGAQTFTTTATAYNRVLLTFNVQSTLSNNSMLVVKIGVSPTGTAPTGNLLVWPHFIL
jgi:hypothetical protein